MPTNNMFGLLASISHANSDTTYHDRKLQDFQSKVDNRFDQSTTVCTIEEEYPYGSGEFREVSCRVVSVRTGSTGNKISDSYKKLIFQNHSHPKNVGYLYRFLDNYWIAFNSNILSGATDSVTVRKCNNILRWKDSMGKINEMPISFESNAYYLVNESKQEVNRNNGYRKAIVQRNNLSRTLQPNQRFIFGTQCLKLSASGINDFLNSNTLDDNSPSIVNLNFEYDYPNPSIDDMVNKIANSYSDVLSVNINQLGTEYTSDNSYTFTATTVKNGEILDTPLIWKIESEKLYEYSVSGNNLSVKFKESGDFKITVSLELNQTLTDSVDINVTSGNTYQIQCDSYVETIYKGDSNIYTFNLYQNGVKIDNINFIFKKLDSLIGYYDYSTNSNSVSIKNNKMSNKQITIECSTTEYTVEPYVLKVNLGGAW